MSKPIVLCIDDDVDNLRIRELLLHQLGYETITACSGASGLGMFQVADVNVVILDYAMPDLNGAQVARRMRALRPDVPILMFSGLTTVPDDVDGQVDAFLVKGRPVEELVQQLEHLLRGRKPPSHASQSSGVRESA
jgi:DNA-binding response OmpR family regulator